MKSDQTTRETDGPVLHILAPARHGGLERVVAMLALGQRSTGVQVACVLSPADAVDHPFVHRLSQLGIPVTRVVVGARSYAEEYRRLRELVALIRPRVINTHGYRSDFMGLLLRRNLQVPFVSTVHGFVGGSARNRINEALQRRMLRRVDALIAVSPPLARRLAESKISKEKIHLVQNGILLSETAFSRADARKSLGIPDKKRVAGWVGRLSREKGPDVALEAIALAGDSWTLAMIGAGPQREALTDQLARLGIEDRVTLHGEIPDAATLLSAFDAFVLSSRTEGTPIVLLEAMRAGVPVVATAVGGVPDVITLKEALLVPSENPQLLANGLNEIAGDPAAASRRAAAGHERLRSGFDLESWVRNVEDVYAAAIGAAR